MFVFHGEGVNESVTVRKWFAINRTKTKKLDKLIMSSGSSTWSLK